MQSKVFRDFLKKGFMNSKIIISISVIITIIVVVFSLTQNEIIQNQILPEINDSSEIQNVMDKIKEDKIKNDNADNPYKPSEREWNESGPFSLDRSQYVIGEKLFVNMRDIDEDVKGKMVFTKIINSTHVYDYKTIKFDGSNPQMNFYLSLTLNELRGICNVDFLTGDWQLVFEGTDYESLKFKVINQTLPGMERNYKPVC
tara:strand:+ start:698 stop:1300 length:603 start_codon:yes stop_codon:yes gene_type:complete